MWSKIVSPCSAALISPSQATSHIHKLQKYGPESGHLGGHSYTYDKHLSRPLDRRWEGEKASQTIGSEIRLEGSWEFRKIKEGFSRAMGELLCCDYRSSRYGVGAGRGAGWWEHGPRGAVRKKSERGLSRDCAGERLSGRRQSPWLSSYARPWRRQCE